ncbi:CAP domain-containing protein [Halobacteriaceae archaeon GCM10025711]
MGKCSHFDCEGDDSLGYTCNYCGQSFCSTHRLPENHACQGLKPASSDEPWFRKDLSRSGLRKSSPRSQSEATGSRLLGFLWTVLLYPVRLLLGLLQAIKRWLQRILGWGRRNFIFLIGILVVVGALIAFGPLSATTVVPGPMGEDIDSTLKAAGSSLQTPGNATTTAANDQTKTTQQAASSGELNRAVIEQAVHENINERRASHGLSRLDYDTGLQEIARYHSRDMAENAYFAHTSPGGETMSDRYDTFGYSCRVPVDDNRYSTGAENIAYTYFEERIRTDDGGTRYYDTADEVATGLVNQWMNSSGHRENILEPYWENEGIGVYVIEDTEGHIRVYATQNFC